MSFGPVTRRSALQMTSAALFSATVTLRPRPARGDVPRVLSAGQRPMDRRLTELKDLDGYFPFEPSATAAAWKERADYVRRQVLVACGLWPMPPRPDIQATIHGKVERDDYTVERVSFESHPGLFVTGSLYRPKGTPGKSGANMRPAVICPHGHWANGRFHDHGAAKGKQELELGAEQFETGGRHPLQARCVHLARMGCVAFLYDMLGYADNNVLSFDLIHRFGKQRPEMSAADHWGLFSAQSELRCLNALGLQTWNSIRVLDWISTLPDVDPDRMGVTGASGGGTQTFILGCVDDRPRAFFPAVMVSTAMQGGCTCENASYLRVNTGNIELAAMIAPRHLAMSAANDWTRELESKGLPQLRQHYAMLKVADRVDGKYFPFEHNYNHPSRRMMYEFFQKALELGDVNLVERDYVPLTQAEATVWDAQHPEPAQGDAAEIAVLQAFDKDFHAQLQQLTPKDQPSLFEYRRIIGGGWDVLIGRNLNTGGAAEWEPAHETQRTGYREFTGWVRNTARGEACPTLFLLPEGWNQQMAVWLTNSGKAGLLNADGSPRPAIRTLLQQGTAVAGVDLLYQGEFQADGQPLTETPRVKNPREFLGYTIGYNHPLFSQRVHDVLTLIGAARRHRTPPQAIHLIGEGKTGLVAAAAAVQAGDAVTKLAVLSDGFRFGSVTEIRDPWLLPGAVRYGDVDGLLALRAGMPVWFSEPNVTAQSLPLLSAAMAASAKPNLLKLTAAASAEAADNAAAWLHA